MTVDNNHEVRRKLLALCDRQLEATISDAEGSITRVTADLRYSIRVISILSDSLREREDFPEHERGLFGLMEKNFNNVLVHLQFFDEFYQRIGHVRELLCLLRGEGESAVPMPGDDEACGELIREIFSIRAEFEVIREMFPGVEQEQPLTRVELF